MHLSLLEQGLVDEFRLHTAPRILGDNAALPLFDGRAPLRMDESLNMRISSCGHRMEKLVDKNSLKS